MVEVHFLLPGAEELLDLGSEAHMLDGYGFTRDCAYGTSVVQANWDAAKALMLKRKALAPNVGSILSDHHPTNAHLTVAADAGGGAAPPYRARPGRPQKQSQVHFA